MRNLDLEVAPGERVAILGGDGTGKSALADVIFGLREPDTGAIELDGIDVRDMKSDTLRRHVALVRDVESISGSVSENVRMGREWVHPGDVRRALASVGLLDTVTHLPDGLHTRLNPFGSPLSHNQAIRLMVARALAGSPRLLVLDGTLERLEEDSQDLLIANLAGPLAPWTLIVLTHDVEVAERFDRSIRLDSAFDHRHRPPPRQLPDLHH
ncbi:MAG: ATP-binding cassette domain-containing protein [Isosphaeraceae bacterium]